MKPIEEIDKQIQELSEQRLVALKEIKSKFLKSLDPLLKELEKVEIPKSLQDSGHFDSYLLKGLILQIKYEH